MNEMTTLVLRFLHVGGAALGLGGLIVGAAALPKMPSDEARAALAVNALHAHGSPEYRTALNVKAVLGFLVFLFATFVYHPAPAFRPFAERRAMWSGVLIVAGLLTVALGAKLHGYYHPSDPVAEQQFALPGTR